MRLFAALAVFALAAAPAHALQKLGERTLSPEQLLQQMEAADPALEQAIAAASAHPLGSRQNPVRVGGPDGERAYLARLHCGDGSRPRVGSRSDAGIGAFGSVVGAYALDCGAAAPGKAELVMDMYHEEHRESRAPAGFTLDAR